MTQKRFGYILLVTILGLFMMATVAGAQESNRGGQIDTAIAILGQPFVPDGPAKEGVAPETAAPAVLPMTDEQKLAVAPEAPSVIYVYKVRETFEGLWPNGNWYTVDTNGATGGQVCWDDDDFKYFRGRWSGYAANGCANAIDPQFSFYPHQMDSWMVNGPFSTVGATAGKLNFKYWNKSEANFDYLWWCASPNGSTFYCVRHTGNSGGWKSGLLNLKTVPGYGNMLGDPTVWAAWRFTSDSSIANVGAFVDNAGIVVSRP